MGDSYERQERNGNKAEMSNNSLYLVLGQCTTEENAANMSAC